MPVLYTSTLSVLGTTLAVVSGSWCDDPAVDVVLPPRLETALGLLHCISLWSSVHCVKVGKLTGTPQGDTG